MRVFVAAEMADDLLFALAETQAALRQMVRGRYVPPDSLHMTLAFLGEVTGPDLPCLSGAVDAALDGLGPVEVTLGELGSFGPSRKATLWQAVRGKGVTRLADAVRGALDGAGFAYDATPFVPHVTLMRGADVTQGTLCAPCCVTSSIEAVCVYRSYLHAEGATYEVLDRIVLGS